MYILILNIIYILILNLQKYNANLYIENELKTFKKAEKIIFAGTCKISDDSLWVRR